MSTLTDLDFDIVEHIGVIEKYETGWQKELNIVQWAGLQPKFDIRDWSKDHKHMSRGLTLTTEQAKALRKLLESKIISLAIKNHNQNS